MPKNEEIEEIFSNDPLRGFKSANVWINSQTAHFISLNGVSYTAECNAICPTPHVIPLPVQCYCGFYAWKSSKNLDEYPSGAKLQVDLFGSVIEGENGFRAESQSVLAVDFGHKCTICHEHTADTLGHPAFPGYVNPICNDCLERKNFTAISSVELSGLLGTRVVWRPIYPKKKKFLPNTDSFWKSFVPSLITCLVAALMVHLQTVPIPVFIAVILSCLIIHALVIEHVRKVQATKYFTIYDKKS